ncbi:uncharacterized protein KNAG_0F03330 [Huiozyma naganishii CBS 8797]|uniref:Uncharacterized protein n=1 Tax=Huiozyma naganishii (strain ATCC MYA-139 / BCRC 22969 / CBS 8797 / KCTC 17520 / NBRC 10181 / NCYC 3082 / Yp74L-3) TaxID=1071383 RepID=J7R822_HUIN7|nr:hypothetical protein KNAG_0F03330 [Kazachstania naganishii CBS 8797]CCK70995.1 hypothetical protein KNAG_0F03330 [Kazachstania naganishii CBS 8797]
MAHQTGAPLYIYIIRIRYTFRASLVGVDLLLLAHVLLTAYRITCGSSTRQQPMFTRSQKLTHLGSPHVACMRGRVCTTRSREHGFLGIDGSLAYVATGLCVPHRCPNMEYFHACGQNSETQYACFGAQTVHLHLPICLHRLVIAPVCVMTFLKEHEGFGLPSLR